MKTITELTKMIIALKKENALLKRKLNKKKTIQNIVYNSTIGCHTTPRQGHC